MGESALEQEASPASIPLSDDDLHDLAEENGYRLVSNAEWKKLKEQSTTSVKEQPTTRANEKASARGMIYIYVPEGFSWARTADILAQAKIIDNSEELLDVMTDMGRQRQLQSGLHTFRPGEPVQDIVEKLSQP